MLAITFCGMLAVTFLIETSPSRPPMTSRAMFRLDHESRSAGCAPARAQPAPAPSPRQRPARASAQARLSVHNSCRIARRRAGSPAISGKPARTRVILQELCTRDGAEFAGRSPYRDRAQDGAPSPAQAPALVQAQAPTGTRHAASGAREKVRPPAKPQGAGPVTIET
jgi:hypothetical protein